MAVPEKYDEGICGCQMARVERYGKDEKMRWQSQVTLGTPSPPMLYNRHMECALLHASFPRVLLASVPAAIKDGIGHTSTLEPLPSFALTPARNCLLPLNLEIWPLPFSRSGI